LPISRLKLNQQQEQEQQQQPLRKKTNLRRVQHQKVRKFQKSEN
jgi:hypothetical protein